MEEQNPNNGQEQKNKTLDSMAKKAKSEVSKFIKKTVKIIIAKIAIPLAIILGGIILISTIYYAIHEIILSNIKEGISNFFKEFKIEERDSLDVSEDNVKELKKIIKNMGYTLKDLSMKEDDSTTDKYLKTFLEAELVTYYPKIGNNGIQGIIKIYRDDGVNGRVELQFIKKAEFDKKILELNNSNLSIAEKIKKYKSEINKLYTVDNDRRLYIATYNSMETDDETKTEFFNVSSKTIDYSKLVEKYAMPVEVPIILSLVTQNPEYVYQFLMKEVMGKDYKTGNKLQGEEWERVIEITLEDTETKTIEKTKYIYDIKSTTITESRLVSFSKSSSGSWTSSETGEANISGPVENSTYAINQETPIKTSKLNLLGTIPTVTYANTWMMYQTIKYTSTPENKNETNINPVSEYPVGLSNPVKSTDYSTTTASPPSGSGITSGSGYNIYTSISYEAINFRKWINTNVDNVKWPEGVNVINQEKIKEKAQRIIKAWDDKYEHPITKGKIAPGYSFKSAPEWLFELLSGARTQKQREIYKYLLFLYTGNNYGVKKLDTSIFNDLDFKSTLGGDIIVDTTKSASALVIDNVKELKKAFGNRKKLVNNADLFLEMQNKYNVNAIFAAAVAIVETSAGTAGHAIDGCNNWFNITTNDENIDHITTTSSNGNVYKWIKYASEGSCIIENEKDYKGKIGFGAFIANPNGRYFAKGNYTVKTIGLAGYCENAEDGWIQSVIGYMQEMYTNLGIDLGIVSEENGLEPDGSTTGGSTTGGSTTGGMSGPAINGGTGANGTTDTTKGQGSWGTYRRGDKTYRLFYQNYLRNETGGDWGLGTQRIMSYNSIFDCIIRNRRF